MKKPDEEILKNWLEGTLQGEELRNVEAWAEANAGDLDAEFKCQIGWCALNDEIMATIPESIEPPYPEFFNSKLKQAISEEIGYKYENEEKPSSSLWQKLRLMMAPAAIAALVAFYAGTQMQSLKLDDNPAGTLEIASEENSFYFPHSGIVAAVSESNAATEIILDGLTPISDELDIVSGDTSPGNSPMMAKTQEDILFSFF